MAEVETRMEGRTLVLTLNRPEAMNALNAAVWQGLAETWARAKADPEVRAVVVTGAGDRAFSAGADLKEMAQRNTTGQSGASSFWNSGEPQIQRGLEFWKPVIAAVNGFALGGGCELAMSCDIRIASEQASFGQPEVTRGIIPGAGGTQRMPRLVPFGIALELLMTGRRITAEEAYRIGLVNHVVPHDQLLPKALEVANEIAEHAPLTVMAIKEAAYRGINVGLQEGLRIENFEGFVVRQTEDAKEGPRAFAEKRPPQYQGR